MINWYNWLAVLLFRNSKRYIFTIDRKNIETVTAKLKQGM